MMLISEVISENNILNHHKGVYQSNPWDSNDIFYKSTTTWD